MSATPKTDIRSFDTRTRELHVRVATDADLTVKFKRGEILTGDTGNLTFAITLGIDEMETHRIDVTESGLAMLERLEWLQRVLSLAIEGCPR